MKKAVIFDLDGTLTNTLKSLWKSTNMALATAGLPPHEIDSYKYFAGNGAKELIRKSLIADGDTELVHFDSVMEAYNRIFEEYCMYEVKPYDGIRELLKALKEKGLHLAVNSNKPQPRTVDVVEEIFGKDTFDLLVGQCEERRRKPAPDGVNYILEQLHLNKEDVLYIGDTCTDMQTGKSAGVFTVGALWGFRDRQELVENHADAIIEKPLELLQYIDQ
ncbi:MAG: HAD family hydrolase [Firmicutes bacterium]|nr:HAD family hydrolase [Bacillota bacterium]MDD6695835.1 HAD family hydrolase [Bacillota bacterium]